MKFFPNQIFVVIDDKKSSRPVLDFDKYDEDNLRRLNEQGYGIFFSVNSFSKGQRIKENLIKLNAIYGDLDVAKNKDGQLDKVIEQKKDILRDALLSYCPPSSIISTRNGLQPIWLINEKSVMVETQNKYSQVISGLISWSKQHGALGDPVKDVTRVLRIPTYYHHKQGPYLITEVAGNNKIYTLDELKEYFWEEPKKLIDYQPPASSADFKPVLDDLEQAVADLDVRSVVLAAWKYKGMKAEFNRNNQLIVDGELCATFVNRDGGNFISNGGSTNYPAQGNAVTYVAGMFGISNKDAFNWLVKEFGLEEKKMEKYPDPIFIKELMEKNIPPIQWLIENIFTAGTINLISAAANQWKSWIMLYCSIKIAKGEPIFGKFATEKRGVLIVNEEDPERMLRNRSFLLNQKIEDLPIAFYLQKGIQITTEEIKQMIEIMKKHNLSVVTLDPLSLLHDADENSAAEMNKVFKDLSLFIKEGFSVIIASHNRKKPIMKGMVDNGQEQVRGSSAINANLSGHITCEPFEVGNAKYLTITQHKLKEAEKLRPFIVEIKIEKDTKIDFFYNESSQQNSEVNIAQKAAGEIERILRQSELPLTKGEIVDLQPAGAGRIAVEEAFKILAKADKINFRTKKELGMPCGPGGTANTKMYYLKDKGENTDKMIGNMF